MNKFHYQILKLVVYDWSFFKSIISIAIGNLSALSKKYEGYCRVENLIDLWSKYIQNLY